MQRLAAAVELPDLVKTFIGTREQGRGGVWWGELCRILLQAVYADEGLFIRFVRTEPDLAWKMLDSTIGMVGDKRVSERTSGHGKDD